MRIALASDHGGFQLKEQIKNYLEEQGFQYEDFGTKSTASVDYPDFALVVAQRVAQGEFERGIIICGTGIGISIAANKVPGIRAALCNDSFSAKASREHNNANLLALGERVTGPALAINIVETWLKTEFEGGRHQKRLDKITAIENQYNRLSKKEEAELNLAQIASETRQAVTSYLEKSKLKEGQILVVGCSTSEIIGKKIGSAGNLAVGETLMEELSKAAAETGVFLAIQGCEHINRALVVEEACAKAYDLEIVNVVPHQRAGGALSQVAMTKFINPVVVENIKGHGAMDIGDTFVGMHLRQIAFPIRLPIKKIGQAHATFAATRPKYIGGERAKYTLQEEKN